MDKDITVYTSITGGKDRPRKDIKVFGSYDRFKDPRMNAKIYKMLPHLFLEPSTDYSIFVDGNLFLKISPEVLVDKADKDVAVFEHHARNDVYEEAMRCKEKGLDNPNIIDNQVKRYKREGFDGGKLGACFLIVRKHTKEVARLNEKWWAEVTSESVRDQISFPYVYRDVDYFELNDVRENKYFKREYHAKGDTLYTTLKNQVRKRTPEVIKEKVSNIKKLL